MRSCKDQLATQKMLTTSSNQGFTLVETIIAMLMGMVISLGTASLFLYAVRYNSMAEERSRAIAVAQLEVERLRTITYDQLVDTTIVPTTERSITSAGRTYRLQTTITTNGTLRTITVRSTPQSETGAWAAVELRTLRAAP